MLKGISLHKDKKNKREQKVKNTFKKFMMEKFDYN